jgi:hypothetical protein
MLVSQEDTLYIHLSFHHFFINANQSRYVIHIRQEFPFLFNSQPSLDDMNKKRCSDN